MVRQKGRGSQLHLLFNNQLGGAQRPGPCAISGGALPGHATGGSPSTRRIQALYGKGRSLDGVSFCRLCPHTIGLSAELGLVPQRVSWGGLICRKYLAANLRGATRRGGGPSSDAAFAGNLQVRTQ